MHGCCLLRHTAYYMMQIEYISGEGALVLGLAVLAFYVFLVLLELFQPPLSNLLATIAVQMIGGVTQLMIRLKRPTRLLQTMTIPGSIIVAIPAGRSDFLVERRIWKD